MAGELLSEQTLTETAVNLSDNYFFMKRRSLGGKEL
jgi:hypothetical protein